MVGPERGFHLESRHISRREVLISACLAGVLLAALTPHWLLAGADGIPAISPLFGNFGTHAAVADSQLLVWILAWDAHALVTQPLSFFDANIFYPAGRMLTGSEALITTALLALPLNLLTGNAVLAANFAAWCSYWLALVLTWVLLRGCGRSMLASALGAVIFGLAPFLVPETLRILQLPHWMLPAVILAVRPRAGGGTALRTFLVTLLALFGSYYIAAMTLVVLAVEFLLTCLAKNIGRGLRMAAATIPAGLLLILFSLPYFSGLEEQLPVVGTGFLPPEITSVLLLRYINPAEPEFGATLGMLLLAALAVGAPILRRNLADTAWLRFVLLTLAGTAVAAGQELVIFGTTLRMPLGWAGEFEFLRVLRATPRFLIVTQLGIAGLAAIGLDLLARLLSRAGLPVRLGNVVTAIAALLAILAPLRAMDRESFLAQPQREHRAAAYSRLEEEPRGVLLEIPGPRPTSIHRMSRLWSQGTHMIASTTHWRPIAGGHTGYAPWWWGALAHEIVRTPDPQALAAAIELTGARHILVHRYEIGGRRWLAWLEANEKIPWLRKLYEDESEILFAVDRKRETDWVERLQAGRPEGDETRLGTPLRGLSAEEIGASLHFVRMAKNPMLGNGRIVLNVRNEGSATWPALVRPDREPPGLVVLEATRLDETGRVLRQPRHFRLPRDLRPGERTIVPLKVPHDWVTDSGAIKLRLVQLGTGVFDHVPELVVKTPGG